MNFPCRNGWGKFAAPAPKNETLTKIEIDMKENFEKYVAVTKLLGEFKLNLRKQILANIREILEQLPNNEINIDTETYNIWTDKDDFITKVYLNEVDKRLIVDTESDVGRDWYCADELDILEAITDILTKD